MSGILLRPRHAIDEAVGRMRAERQALREFTEKVEA
jgi:hypothetical protein